MNKKETRIENKDNKKIVTSTISSSLITYIIIMTVLALAFGFVTYGFTMYQITENKVAGDEAIFIFLCFFVGLYLLLMVLFCLLISNQLPNLSNY